MIKSSLYFPRKFLVSSAKLSDVGQCGQAFIACAICSDKDTQSRPELVKHFSQPLSWEKAFCGSLCATPTAFFFFSAGTHLFSWFNVSRRTFNKDPRNFSTSSPGCFSFSTLSGVYSVGYSTSDVAPSL